MRRSLAITTIVDSEFDKQAGAEVNKSEQGDTIEKLAATPVDN